MIQLHAQRFDWVSTGGYAFTANSFVGAVDIARDSKGNLYTIDLGNGAMQCQGDTIFNPPGPASNRSFVYKFDPEGNLIFMKVIGSSSNPKNLETDENDNLYVLVQMTGTTLVLPADTMINVTQGSTYVLMFDEHFKFKRHFDCGNPGFDQTHMLQYANGALYLQKGSTGIAKVDTNMIELALLTPIHHQAITAQLGVAFRGSAIFANGDLLFAAHSRSNIAYIEGDTLQPSDNVFLTAPHLYLRCDTNLNVIWAKYFGNFRDPDSHFLPVSIGNDDQIYSLVQVNSQLIVGTDTVNGNASNIGTFTMLKISDTGNGVWARQFGDVHTTRPYNILNIPDGSGVFACGTFAGSQQFGPLTPNPIKGRAFIAKMDYEGNYLNVFTFTGNTFEPTCLTTDGQGSFFVGGKCQRSPVPVFSCEARTPNNGFYLARFTEEPDEAPTPEITVDGNILTANPPFSGNIQWFFNDEPIAGATSQTYTATENGDYRVQYAYIDGCISEASSEVTNVVISSVLNLEKIVLKVYPNPAGEMLFLETHANDAIHITDISGRAIKTLPLSNQHLLSINLSSFQPGTYLVRQGKNVCKFMKL